METNKKVIEMKCSNNIVIFFVSRHFHKTDNEYEEIKQHIIHCEKCFKELIRLAPKYDSRVEE